MNWRFNSKFQQVFFCWHPSWLSARVRQLFCLLLQQPRHQHPRQLPRLNQPRRWSPQRPIYQT